MMSKLERYTQEYREEAVKLVLEQGKTQAEAAQQLGMPQGTRHSWLGIAKGTIASKFGVAPGARSIPELESELAKLRRELNTMRMERDIIKKAAAYFAQESLPGTRT